MAGLVVLLGCGQESGGGSRMFGDIERKLHAFDVGELSYDELTGSEENCNALLNYYLAHSNAVSVKGKLPISRCFGYTGHLEEANRLATDYVRVYSNDWRGWRIIGTSFASAGSFDKAVYPLRRAVSLGDASSRAPLAFAALESEQVDIVGGMIPELLEARTAVGLSPTQQMDAVAALVIYSIKTEDADTFARALEGIDAKRILAREDDLATFVNESFEDCRAQEVERIRREMHKAGYRASQ